MEGLARYLAGALEDASLWVRVGAALTIPTLCPTSGADLLLPRARALEPVFPLSFSRWLRRSNEDPREKALERATLIMSIERAGRDSGRMLANLLGDEPPALAAAIGENHDTAEANARAHDNWALHLQAKVDSKKLPIEAARMLLPGRGVRLVGTHRRSGAIPMQAYAAEPVLPPSAAVRALREMRFWTTVFFLGEDRDQVITSSSLATTANLLEEGDLVGAGQGLVRVVLSEPNRLIRTVAQKTLASIGVTGCLPLLPALHGNPPYLLTPEEASRIGVGDDTEVADPVWGREIGVRHALAAFLAAEALEEFIDPASVLTVVSLAIGSNGPAPARAERVVAHMSTDYALPALFWCAVNRARSDERDRASALLSRIVARDALYELDYYRIGPTRFEGDLKWLPELAQRAMRLNRWEGGSDDELTLAWARSQEVSLPLLGSAIRAIPEVYGHPLVLDREEVDSGRFANFQRSIWEIFRGRRSTPQPPAVERRTPRIRFPDRCVLGIPEELTVQLDLADPSTPGVGTFDVTFPDDKIAVKLLVFVRAPGFLIDPGCAAVPVVRANPSPTVTFTLRARELGPQTVEVMFYLDAERIGHYCLVSQVGQEGSAAGNADTRVMHELSAADLVQRAETRAAIFVRSQPDGRLSYSVLDPAVDALRPRFVGTSPIAVTAQLADQWLEQQGAIIRDQLSEDYSEADLKGVLASIASIGQALFKRIAPTELARALRNWPRDAVIAIESDVSWVPWELLTESAASELWGERFQIVRMPVVPHGTRGKLPLMVAAGSSGDAWPVDKVSGIVGDEIVDSGEEPASVNRDTFEGLLPLVTDLIQVTWDELRSGVENADIVHFTCHVRRTPVLYFSYGPGQGRKLYVSQVESLGLRPGTVVFANGCGSGKPELMLAEFENFGFEFYAQGARPYIGTLGPVPVKAARAFARLFYEWFILKGLPPSQALHLARRDAAQKLRTPVWLYYCMYGPAAGVRIYNGASAARAVA